MLARNGCIYSLYSQPHAPCRLVKPIPWPAVGPFGNHSNQMSQGLQTRRCPGKICPSLGTSYLFLWILSLCVLARKVLGCVGVGHGYLCAMDQSITEVTPMNLPVCRGGKPFTPQKSFTSWGKESQSLQRQDLDWQLVWTLSLVLYPLCSLAKWFWLWIAFQILSAEFSCLFIFCFKCIFTILYIHIHTEYI